MHRTQLEALGQCYIRYLSERFSLHEQKVAHGYVAGPTQHCYAAYFAFGHENVMYGYSFVMARNITLSLLDPAQQFRAEAATSEGRMYETNLPLS